MAILEKIVLGTLGTAFVGGIGVIAAFAGANIVTSGAAAYNAQEAGDVARYVGTGMWVIWH